MTHKGTDTPAGEYRLGLRYPGDQLSKLGIARYRRLYAEGWAGDNFLLWSNRPGRGDRKLLHLDIDRAVDDMQVTS